MRHCFNSTMVRLKLEIVERLSGDQTSFQFHYGSIKIMFLTSLYAPSSSFNSTMVRLKYDIQINRDDYKLFQFHYGSIRMNVSHIDVFAHAFLFQFHYGSIRIFRAITQSRIYASFNSTMVRLKLEQPLRLPHLDVQFQFHYGSIKILTSRHLVCL